MNNQHGTLSLSLLFSTISGALFILLFYNLTLYVSASAALHEAARKAARCITPTDPECVSVQTNLQSNIEQRWYGYPNAPGQRDISASIPLVKYQAHLTRLDWGAEYTTYEIHRAKQPFEITTYLVPVKTFEPLGPYEIPYGTIHASFRADLPQEFRPLYEPNFPRFEQDESLPPELWIASQAPLQFPSPHRFPTSLIPARQEALFETGFIQVPELNAEPDAVCKKADGTPCDTELRAGEDTPRGNWKDTAYLALKVFSQVATPRGRSSVRWGRRNGGPGLYIQIRDRHGNITERCLGGRTSEEVTTKPSGYNLWLRGPSGAHGGSGSSCPNGSTHDKIAIPRGGAFNVKAYMTAAGREDVSADVQVVYYLDGYNLLRPEKEVRCRPIPYRGQKAAKCPSLNECTPATDSSTTIIDYAIPWKLEQCTIQQEGKIYTCNESQETAGNTRLTPFIEPVTAAVCHNDWEPSIRVQKESEQPVKLCGWEATQRHYVEVASAQSCPTAARTQRKKYCEMDNVIGELHSESSCVSLQKDLAAAASATLRVNNAQPDGAPRFDASAKSILLPQEDSYWQFSWSPKSDDARNLSVERNKLKVNRNRLSSNNYRSTFKRHLLKNEPPPLQDFLLAVMDESGRSANEPGFEEYKANLANEVFPYLAAETATEITQVFPFIEPVRELYYGQTVADKGYDFDADCSTDFLCKSNHEFSSLEELLREHAALQFPEAGDASYVFSYSATPVGFERLPVRTQAQLAALSLPDCTPLKVACGDSPPAAAPPDLLGVGITAPPECVNGSYLHCFGEPLPGVPPAQQTEVVTDINRAKQIALVEVREILPYAYLQEKCSEGMEGCTSVSIELSSDGHAIVHASHELGLVFPLSTILQRDTLTLTREVSEVVERALLERASTLH